MNRLKKSLFIFFIISVFFHIDVFAEDNIFDYYESIPNDGAAPHPTITVCSKKIGDCDYTTLDQALSYMETFHYDDESHVYPPTIVLKDNTTQTLTNHTLDTPVGIESDSTNNIISIDGNGSTISSNYPFYFNAPEVKIQNFNSVLLKTANFNNYDYPSFFNFYVSRLTLDNFHLTYAGEEYSCITDPSRALVGVRIQHHSYSGEYRRQFRVSFYDSTITNSSITNFDIAVESVDYSETVNRISTDNSSESIPNDGVMGGRSTVLTVDNCDFYDNFLSFYFEYMYSLISNSKLSSIVGRDSNVKLLDGNSFGEAKVIKVHSYIDQETMYSEEYYNSLMDDLVQICAMTKNKKNVYIMGSDNNYTTSVVEIHLEKTKEVDSATNQLSMLDQFINTNEVDTSTFVYSSSDESVAKIENGKVVLLKNQDVDITAVSRDTYETYVLHLKVNHSLIQNPVTGTMFVFILFGILFGNFYILFRYIKKRVLTK